MLFTDATSSACGYGDAAVGPFYCPRDEHVYIDLGFYDVLRRRLGAPGDFAQAYVIGHEVGHHVQHLLGLEGGGSVAVELQADCFAGVWARSTEQRKLLDPGDIDEAMHAASQIGDDRLQGSHVRPETFTHGSSEQRVHWFKQGYDRGSIGACDTRAQSLR